MLLGLTSTFQPVWLGYPYEGHYTPASIAFNVQSPHHGKVQHMGGGRIWSTRNRQPAVSVATILHCIKNLLHSTRQYFNLILLVSDWQRVDKAAPITPHWKMRIHGWFKYIHVPIFHEKTTSYCSLPKLNHRRVRSVWTSGLAHYCSAISRKHHVQCCLTYLYLTPFNHYHRFKFVRWDLLVAIPHQMA